MTVALRLIVSTIQPNIKAPIGLNTYVEQYAMAEYREAARTSASGKNSSLRSTAMCTYSMRSKYLINVPIDSSAIASF
ncbi:hypothetical protein MC5_03420 [Rickettsia australis str. Cutlack]|uniref:Uncharacterized protein n=1 Tax=Rickettsia australis (strain Cutlack) TaxID=1105110 RepID=H8K6Y3_RICAC|nr:hypothetical protein MC5_03420 [Rickettsia australis str. Cutlack]